MKLFSKMLAVIVVLCLFSSMYAEEKQSAGINLKVGENFFFEGKVSEDADDSKEASMAEIKKTPFYQTTWFIAVVSIVAIAGVGTGIYFLTKEDERSGNVIIWENN